jgi:hypothetical protein
MLNGITVIVHTSIARDWTVTLKLDGIESEPMAPADARKVYQRMYRDQWALLNNPPTPTPRTP